MWIAISFGRSLGVWQRRDLKRLAFEQRVSQTIAAEPATKVGILAVLRRSPLVGADVDLERSREEGRGIEL